MKVLLVGDYPENVRIQTGVQGVLVSLTDGLLKHNEIELVIVPLSKSVNTKKYQNKCNIRPINFRSSIFKARKQFRSIILEERPDVIHLQGTIPGCLLFSRHYKDIFIVTQHAVLNKEREWQVSFMRKIKFYVKELVERYYLRKIHNIIFISDYNREIYWSNIKSPKALQHVTIPNPVNRIFHQMGLHSAASLKNELFFVGEIKKRKGLHILIEALSKLKDQGISCTLHVIGGFKERPYEKHIQRLIEQKGLEQEIFFCGWKSPTEIIEYVKNIPIFVLPSFQETLPLSVAEAMTMGKVVVATDAGGTSEMIQDGISGYIVPPGDPDVLSKTLQRILSEADQLSSISANALKESKKFEGSNVVLRTLQFYKKVIENAI